MLSSCATSAKGGGRENFSRLLPHASAKQKRDDRAVAAPARHAERRPPLCGVCPDARVHIRAASHQQFDDVEMSCAAGLYQGVLVAVDNLIDARTAAGGSQATIAL